jgi:trans-2,3-dihydro-3-hydroxyanthranilate isomerase
MDYRFYMADVFSRRPFGGNQLAVFPQAEGLTPALMQSLAREFNFTETTFVFRAERPGSTARVRIFTPRAELDFAGHPTIGTAAVLASQKGPALHDDRGVLILDENVGPVRVDVTRESGGIHGTLTLEKAVEVPDVRPELRAVADALSLHPDRIVETWFASIGLPLCFVRVRDVSTVDAAALDRHAWAGGMAGAWSPNLFVFAGELAAGATLHARMFAPALGVEEDPATGSACAALASVAGGRLAEPDGVFRWTVEQGVALGRPSTIAIEATKRAGAVTSVRVSGYTVIMGEGVMHVAGA